MCSDKIEYQQVCPQCGMVQEGHLMVCTNCDCRLTKRHVSPVREKVGLDVFSRIGPLLKIALVLAVLAVPTGLVYLAFTAITRSVEESNPYPTDPVETVKQFFTALQNENEPNPDRSAYQSCYNLLTGQRKAATIIGTHDRQSYALHFERIRNYLIKYIGEDFLSTMEISPSGLTPQATFDRYITLTVELGTAKGMDEKTHYNIKQIREFPIDIMPGLGIESRNRGLDSFMDSMEGKRADTPIIVTDDAADVIGRGPGESPAQYLQRLIAAYRGAVQLDVKHDLLEHIISNFPPRQIPPRFLYDIARNEQEAVHLRELAQQIIEEIESY